MRRVLALVAAAAMIAGSLAVRSRLDRGAEERANPLRLICAAELGAVCDALDRSRAEVAVEPAGTTADRLGQVADAATGIDGWLVPAPWPQIVDGQRRSRQLEALFPDVTAPLARSPLVIVAQKSLVTGLAPRCGAAVGWKCLGEAAVDRKAKPGHANPAVDGVGALVIGQATSAYFDRADLSSTDLDDPGFTRWFTALELAAPPGASGGSPLNEMLVTGVAIYDAVGTVEAEAVPVLAGSAARDKVVLLYPSPMATADVVMASVGGGLTRRARDVGAGEATRRALVAAGWRAEGATSANGPPLPATDGLPSPGFLDALRAQAAEVRR